MGWVEVAQGQIIEFASPVLGFESYRRFAILPVEDAPPFHWLQSLEDRQVAFPVVSADELGVNYSAGPEALLKIGAGSWRQVQCWVLVVLPTDRSPIRVNLRAPIVVNGDKRLAAQIIAREEYPVSCALEGCRRALCATA